MPRILALSSQVARGHVGLSAMVPALHALGHEVTALPTVVLSNHPGHPSSAGTRIPAETLGRMLDALWRNGWMEEVAAVVTGYLPAPDHVELAVATVRRLGARRRPLYLCDPVLGDDAPGIYIDPLAAALIRDRLAPLADVLTPNRFETGWLTGSRPETRNEVAGAALRLAGSRLVAVTSATAGDGRIENLLVRGGNRVRAAVPWLAGVPHGTGDLFAALLIGHLLDGQGEREAFACAVAGVDLVVRASAGRDELDLVSTVGAAARAAACPLDPV